MKKLKPLWDIVRSVCLILIVWVGFQQAHTAYEKCVLILICWTLAAGMIAIQANEETLDSIYCKVFGEKEPTGIFIEPMLTFGTYVLVYLIAFWNLILVLLHK